MAGHTCRLKVPENKALTIIFGSKKMEASGGWRGLHNVAELRRFYLSSNVRVINGGG
jgi:hypothetical protein